jgi:hypothetical protein
VHVITNFRFAALTSSGERRAADVAVDVRHKQLRLPPPREFLWQYVHSTPLAAIVGSATQQQRDELADEVAERWQPFVDTGALLADVPVTTVRGVRPPR